MATRPRVSDVDATVGKGGSTRLARQSYHGASTGPARRTVLDNDDADDDHDERTELPIENMRTPRVQQASNRHVQESMSSFTARSVVDPVRSSATGYRIGHGGSALYGSATADLQDPLNFAIRPSNETPRSARSSYALEAPTGIGPEISTPSTYSILSPLSSRLAYINFPEFKECAKFIKQHDPYDFNGYNDFLQEAIYAYRSGDFDYARSCVQASLLLRERVSTSLNRASELFEDLICDRKSAMSDIMGSFERVIEFVKVKASDKKPSSVVTRFDLGTGLESRGPAHGLETMSTFITGQQEYPLSSQHPSSRTEQRLDNKALPAHSEDMQQSQSSPVRPESRMSVPSVQPEDIEIRGTSPEIETLDPRYQMQNNPAGFFVVGRVFALLWHENLGIANASRDRRPEDAYTSKDRFGEKVFSHIFRMVVVRRRYGYSWCIGINTYGGRGLAKRGLSAQVIQAHAIVYDSAGSPYKAPGEPESPSHPIAVLLSPDQQLDKMSRLNFSKVHTVEWNVKVMNIGRVTDLSLPYLKAQWAKETVGNTDEGTLERPRKDSLISRDLSRLKVPSLPRAFGQNSTSLDDDSSRNFQEARSDGIEILGHPSRMNSWANSVGYAPSQSLPRQASGFGNTSVDLSLRADSGPEPSHLTSLGQIFALIRVGQVKECVTFIISNRAVLEEDTQRYLREAGALYRKSRIQDARACVQQALIIDHCSDLDNDDIRDYLSDLAASRKSTVNKLLSNVDKTFAAVKASSDASTLSEDNGTPNATAAGQSRHMTAEREHLPGGYQTQPFPSPTTSDLINRFSSFNVTTNKISADPRPMPSEPSKKDRRQATTGSRDSQTSAGHHTSRNSLLPEQMVRGTDGEFEPLDPRYRQRRDKAEYFINGRVFAILWHENMGITNKKPGPDVKFTRDNRFGEKIFSHIKRMIIVRQRYGYCWCVAINTYGGKGLVGKNRSDAEVRSYTIVYESTSRPAMFKEEQGLMTKEPIAIDMVSGQTLDKASRLNYAKVLTVEHNVKVMDIGMVSSASMPYLLSHWRDEMAQ